MKIDSKNTITFLAQKEYKANHRKNILTVIAILLTTFLITSICSLGISYWNSITRRSIMMEGMKFDIQLPEPNETQVKKAKESDQILYAGVSVKCAIIEKYGEMPVDIRLFWSDIINWEKQCIPAFEFMEGEYPKEKNEVVMSTQTLKEMGIESPEIGMPLNVTYYDLVENGKTHEATLILTGYYRDYSGNSQGFVSKPFYDSTGAKQTDLTQGTLKITLKNPLYTPEDIKDLEKEIGLDENQILFADQYIMIDFLKFMAGLAGLFLLIVVSGYLFIYNILYISIAKEVRFFGQLKMIGTTSTQIKKLIHKQVFWNAVIGIPLGMILGAIVSFIAVPSVLKITNPALNADQIVSFHPTVFVGAALFSLITVFISSRKPAIIAGNISLIEASKYISVDTKKKRRGEAGSKISHMAWRNVFRDKKQAIIIFLSFFVALSALLIANVLVDGNSAKKILNASYDYDIQVRNMTVPTDNLAQRIPASQKITSAELEALKSLEGIASVREVFSAYTVVPYNEETLGKYFKRIYESSIALGEYDTNLALYKEHPEEDRFTGKIVGVDEEGFEKINEKLGGSVNKEEFMLGEVGILKPWLSVSAKECIGKTLTFSLPENAKAEQYSIKIAAESLQSGPNYFSAGLAPDIIVSEQLVKRLLDEPIIELVNIDYTEPFNHELDKKVKEIFKDDTEISFNSKLDDYDEMKQSEDQMKVLGRGLGLILALLAVLNYCNMITSGIQNRTLEFASLQSIGMTSKQMRTLLILEGLYYGVISILFAGIFGTPVSYLIFQSMNKYGVAYSIPVWENLISIGVILMICICIPPLVCRMIQKGSIVERLRAIE